MPDGSDRWRFLQQCTLHTSPPIPPVSQTPDEAQLSVIQPYMPSSHSSHDDSPHVTRGISLRVSVALVRWNGTQLETAICRAGYLPSSVPTSEETLDQTAVRIIREATGVDAQYLEQLYTFSPGHGQVREIVISYLGLFSPDTPVTSGTIDLTWELVDSARPADGLDQMVLDYALVRLQAKLGYSNIAFHLVPSTFTLSELQQTYETILGQPMDKRNFRRRMIASGILTDTHEKRREGSHRPAALYRFNLDDDQASYLTPPRQED